MQPSLPPEGGQTERARRRSAAGFHLLCSFQRKRLAFAQGTEEEPHATEVAAEVQKSHEGLFARVQDNLFHSLRDRQKQLHRWSQESHPTLIGVIKIPWINLPLFLIYLHLFSIKETRVSRSVLSHLITPANEIRCRLTGCRATGPVADRWTRRLIAKNSRRRCC